ncbi:MAG: phosphate ABC transporter substrate-binding protein [Cyclobacteriaceae bacterium]
MKFVHLILWSALVALAACGPSQKKTNNYILKFKGSESMHAAFDMLKNEFERTQDSVKIIIEGGGSRTGLLAIKEGTADVGLSSYRFNLDSILGAKHGVTEHVVAYDGIVLICNKANPVDKLTNGQIMAIFSGGVSDWSQLGGQPGRIVPVIRDQNSGTQKFFQSYFNIDKPNPLAIVSSENKSIVSRVTENQNGIGFIGFGYFTERIKSLDIPSNPEDSAAYASATFRNLGAGKYPLRRSLQMYYRESQNPGLQAFLQYLETPEAALLIKEQGLLPKKENQSIALN